MKKKNKTQKKVKKQIKSVQKAKTCLLYTSDAADDC